VNIKGFINVFFVAILWQYFFQKKPFQQPFLLSLSSTQQIYCDILVPSQNKYNDHNVRCNEICHSYPLHPIFTKPQLEFQTSYMNLKSIHISSLNFLILKWNDISILKIEFSIMKFFIWVQKLLFESEIWYLNSGNFIILI
jgi:hypothetical protein